MTQRTYDDARRWRIVCTCIIVASLLNQFIVTRCGLLLTHDSREYLSAASSFANEGVLLGSDGSPYVFWPPLLPIILSFFSEPQSAMVWIHLGLSALVGVLIARLASQHLSDFRFKVGFVTVWMLGVHQLLISVFLWSELLFVVVLLSFVEQVIRSDKSNIATLLSFALGTLLCLQRNAGLFIVPAAALWIIIKGNFSLKAFAQASIVFLSTIGGLWWNASNMYGTVPGAVSNLEYFSALGHNTTVVTDGISAAIVPLTILSIPIAIAIVCSPVVLILSAQWRPNNYVLMALICCFYLVGMAILFRLDHGDADRYAAVILPFFLLACFKVVENFHQKANNAVRMIILAGMICWIIYPLLRTAKNAIQWREVSCSAQR